MYANMIHERVIVILLDATQDGNASFIFSNKVQARQTWKYKTYWVAALLLLLLLLLLLHKKSGWPV